MLFKLKNDPRVTRVGACSASTRSTSCRSWSTWSAARCRSSARDRRCPARWPATAGHAHRRLRLRPGLTGLWQVSGRSDLSWEESLRLDLRYVDNWSLALDLQILLRTFRAVRTAPAPTERAAPSPDTRPFRALRAVPARAGGPPQLETAVSPVAGKHVLVVGINYAPEPTGIAPYTTGLAEHLAQTAASVEVFTGLPHYPHGGCLASTGGGCGRTRSSAACTCAG